MAADMVALPWKPTPGHCQECRGWIRQQTTLSALLPPLLRVSSISASSLRLVSYCFIEIIKWFQFYFIIVIPEIIWAGIFARRWIIEGRCLLNNTFPDFSTLFVERRAFTSKGRTIKKWQDCIVAPVLLSNPFLFFFLFFFFYENRFLLHKRKLGNLPDLVVSEQLTFFFRKDLWRSERVWTKNFQCLFVSQAAPVRPSRATPIESLYGGF